MDAPPPTRRTILTAGAAAAVAAVSWTARAASAHAQPARATRPPVRPPNDAQRARTAPQQLEIIPVIRRSGWGARRPQGPMRRHTPTRLTLHHTAVLLDDDRLSPSRMRRHQDWHMDDPGHSYPDIAYHFMVDRQGNIFEGRKVRFRGDTATEYDPTGHFLVCCEGDYELQEPTGPQLRAVAGLFAWAAQRWDIAPRRLGGHADYAATTCPGGSLERLVRDRTLRRQVRSLVRGREVRLDYLSRQHSALAVARIEAGSGPLA